MKMPNNYKKLLNYDLDAEIKAIKMIIKRLVMLSYLAGERTGKSIHEGCDGCKHIDDGFDEEPCKWCRYNYEDKWEAKE